MLRLARVVPLFILQLISLGFVPAQQTLGEVRGNGDKGGYSYFYVGDVLQLNCTVNQSSSWQARDLIFALKNDVYNGSIKLPEEEVSILSNSTLQLNHRIRGREDAGEYLCQIETAQELLLVGRRKVYVQYRPQKVTVHCEVKDWDVNLNCTLGYGTGYVDNSNSTDFSPPDVLVNVLLMVSSSSMISCHQPISAYDRTSQCVWSGDSYRAAPRYVLIVDVKNNITGDRKRTPHRIITGDIVRPTPVSHIWTTDVNSTCVPLAWNHTRIHRKMLFRVNVTATGFSQVVYSTSTVACGLQPHRTYNVSVECRPRDSNNQPSGFWSEAKRVTVRTMESVPESSFLVHDGGYLLGPCKGGRRNVTIFFKEVPASEQNGEIIGYQLQYDGKTVIKNVTSPTSAVVTNVSCGSELPVRIFARTKVGPSKSNAMLRINTEDAQPVAGLAVEMLGRGGRLVWNNTSDGNDTDVAVFWCLRDKAFDRTCRLETSIQWVDAAFSLGGVTIPQLTANGQDANPKDYLFGIAVAGRAIVWASCYFSQKIPMQTPEMKVKVINQQLDMDWNSQQCTDSYPVHTTGYRLYYCELEQCHSGLQMVELNAEKNYYSMQGNPGSSYNISMQAVDFYGRQSPLSPPHIEAIPKAEDFPLGAKWAVICTGLGSIVVLCLCCGCRIFRKCKDAKAKFDTDYHSTLGPQEEHRNNLESPAPSSPSPLLEHDPTSDSDIEGISCQTTLTEVDRNLSAAPRGSSYCPHDLMPSVPQNRDLHVCPGPQGCEAPLVDDLAIPLTELSPTVGVVTGPGPFFVEGSQSHRFSCQTPALACITACKTEARSTEGGKVEDDMKPSSVTACTPEASIVVGGKNTDYRKLPDSLNLFQNADKSNVLQPGALGNLKLSADFENIASSLGSESDCSDLQDDAPLDISTFINRSDPTFRPRDQAAGFQNVGFVPTPQDVPTSVQSVGQSLVPGPDVLSSQNGNPPALQNANAPWAEVSPRQSDGPAVPCSINPGYYPWEDGQQHVNSLSRQVGSAMENSPYVYDGGRNSNPQEMLTARVDIPDLDDTFSDDDMESDGEDSATRLGNIFTPT